MSTATAPAPATTSPLDIPPIHVAPEDIAGILETISELAVCVGMSISLPLMKYDPGEEARVQFGTTEIDKDDVERPKIKILPDDWKTRFNEFRNRARQLWIGSSVDYGASFGFRGLRMLADLKLAEYRLATRELATEMDQLRTEFVEDYPRILADARSRLQSTSNELWLAVYQRLPRADRVGAKLSIRLPELQIRLRRTDGPAAAALIDEVMMQPRRVLAQSIQNLRRIVMESTFRTASRDTVITAIDAISSFSFLLDEPAKASLLALRGTLSGVTVATDINLQADGGGGSLRDSVLAAADATLQRLVDTSAAEQQARSLGRRRVIN